MFLLIYRNNNKCGDQTLIKHLTENSIEKKQEYSVISIARLNSFQNRIFLNAAFLVFLATPKFLLLNLEHSLDYLDRIPSC